MRKVILDFSADKMDCLEPYKYDCLTFFDNFSLVYLCGFEDECFDLQLIITEQLWS